MHFLLLAALWFLPAVSARQAQTLDLNGHRLSIEADAIQVDGVAHKVYLIGGALLRSGQTTFRADQMVIDYTRPDRPAATANGHVVLDSPRLGRVTGDRLRYDLEVRRGEIHDVEVTIPLHFEPHLGDLMRPDEVPKDLRVKAVEGAQVGNELLLRGASVTFSPSKPPQFLFKADQLILTSTTPDIISGLDRLRTRGVKLQLYGATLVGLPDMTIRSGEVIIPRLGYDSTYGFSVQRSVAFAAKPFRLVVTPRIGTRLFFTGRVDGIANTPVGRFTVSEVYRDRIVLPVSRTTVLYSRTPELSWQFPEYELPQVGGKLIGRLSGGWYREDGGVHSWRGTAELSYQRALYRDRSTYAWAGGSGWYSIYGSHGHYGWLRGDVGVERRFGDLAYVGMSAYSHWLDGASPLRFDRIELVTDLAFTTRWRLSQHWLVGNRYDYDLNHHTVRREEYSVAYRDRLLEYQLRFLMRPSFEVNVGARVLGF